jgi:signal transduction histidine kinase
MKDLIRHGTSYFVVTVVTVTVYFIAITLVQRVFAEMSLLYSRLVGVSVAAITLTVLYKPLYELSQRVVDSTLFGVRHDHVDTLQDYEEHISQIADLHELAAKSVTLIGHAFGAGRGALLNVEDQGANLELWLIPGLGIVESFSREWPRDHPLLQFFQETGAPLTQRDIERSAEFEDLTERDQAWLDQLGMEVYVPIKAFDELIGIIALGPQSSGKPYDRNDLLLLQDLAKQTALILRNAQRLFELSAINLGIAELNEELQQLDQAKSNFLTIASHELKTPLTLIQGYANILVSLPPADLMDQAKLEHITQGISRGTERLRQIIDDMIDISRLDADAFTLHWKECQLSHVLGVAIDQLRPAAEERDQTIITSGLEEIPPFEGDAQRLHRAFRNVIENAIKYTPDGGQVSISARPLGGEDPEEQFIEVVISDTGIGIDPEDQERIFEKFYRVGDASLHSSSRVQFKGGGPGLGLAISKGIIEAHGGKIWAASEGHDEENCPGSEFHILLMVKAPDQRARFVEEYQLKGQSTLSEDFNL